MARKKKLITLAKELDFQTEDQYFDYCISSHINGNRDQCRKLFNDMSREDQKNLLRDYLNADTEVYSFYFDLL